LNVRSTSVTLAVVIQPPFVSAARSRT